MGPCLFSCTLTAHFCIHNCRDCRETQASYLPRDHYQRKSGARFHSHQEVISLPLPSQIAPRNTEGTLPRWSVSGALGFGLTELSWTWGHGPPPFPLREPFRAGKDTLLGSWELGRGAVDLLLCAKEQGGQDSAFLVQGRVSTACCQEDDPFSRVLKPASIRDGASHLESSLQKCFKGPVITS